MKIDVVIPNYNGFNLIEKNLPILIKYISKYNVGQIVITDDFSKEEDFNALNIFVEKIKKTHPIKLRLLRNKKNLGFSSNVNNGVSACNSDLVFLLNTDIVVEENFLDDAIKHFVKNEELFGVGLMDKSIEEEKVILRGRGVARWSRGFLVHSRGEVDKKDTFWISGGSSLIRRKIFEEIGGFDPLYNPFYWEDIDLSYRAQKSGYNILFEPKSVVEHHHDKGAIKKHYKNNQIKKIAYRNQFTFIWKNITDSNLIISHTLWLPYHFAHAIINFDTAFFIGFFYAVVRIPAIIQKRKKQKKQYRKKDSELLHK